MARPSNYTDEEILGAADKVKAQGKPVTGYGLSKALGGGNPDTLFRRYGELTSVAEPAAAVPVVPSDVLAAVGEVTSDVGKRLTEILTTTYASLRAAANARVDEVEVRMQQQHAIHAEEIRDAVERIATEEERADAAEHALKTTQEEAQQLRVALASKDASLLESQRNEKQLSEQLASASCSLSELERKAATLQAQLSQSVSDKARVEQQNERLSTQLAEANSKRESAQREAAANGALVGQLKDTEKRLQGEAVALHQETGKLSAQVAQLTDEKTRLLERAKAQKEAHAAEQKSLQEKLSEQAKRLDAQAAEIQKLKVLSEGSKRG